MDLGFVLVSKAKYPDAKKLVKHAAALGLELTRVETGDDKEMLTFELAGGGTVIYALMPAPHPDAPHMPTGPTAIGDKELAAQKAHFIVTAMQLPGDVEQRDFTTAALVAALIQCTDALGAMLAHGVVFHKAELFAGMVGEGAKEGALPPEIAVDITIARESEDRMSFLTSGMERYGREELYVTCPINGQGALGFVFDMTRWLLQDRDKQLPTGDTLGRTADEKIRIQRVPNPRGQGAPVIRLDLAH